ncbi:MAG: hypothetical protein H5T72_05495 [Actinobacteria bacterium]|nr:hypothetical protein [Actinomycetota bacterium]
MDEDKVIGEAGEYRQYAYRWVVLLIYGFILVAQAVLWPSFAPIESCLKTAHRFS